MTSRAMTVRFGAIRRFKSISLGLPRLNRFCQFLGHSMVPLSTMTFLTKQPMRPVHDLCWSSLAFLTLFKSDITPKPTHSNWKFVLAKLWLVVKVIWFFIILPVTIFRQVAQFGYLMTTPHLTFAAVMNIFRWRIKHIAYFLIVILIHLRQNRFRNVFDRRSILSAYTSTEKRSLEKLLKKFDLIFTIVSLFLLVIAYFQTETSFYVFETRENVTEVFWPFVTPWPSWAPQLFSLGTVGILAVIEALVIILFCIQLYAGIRYVKTATDDALISFSFRNPTDNDLVVFDHQLRSVKLFRTAIEKAFGTVFAIHLGACVVLAAGLIGEISTGKEENWTGYFVCIYQVLWTMGSMIGVPAFLCIRFKEKVRLLHFRNCDLSG